ncbi:MULTISPECIES: superoxide dismutase family protein [unclassified Modestobacter]
MPRRYLVPAATALLLLAACGDNPTGPGGTFTSEDGEVEGNPTVPVEESAYLVDPEGSSAGRVTFSDAETGMEVTVEATGLPPGEHPLSLHETADCDAPATPDDPTLIGDWTGVGAALPGVELPQLVVGDDGTGEVSSVVANVDLDTLLAEDGTALLVHAVGADGEDTEALACAPVGG